MLKSTAIAAALAMACRPVSPHRRCGPDGVTTGDFALDSFEYKQTARATAPRGGFAAPTW